jgi:hypothetical protein
MVFIQSQFEELFDLLRELEDVSEEYKLDKVKKNIVPEFAFNKEKTL